MTTITRIIRPAIAAAAVLAIAAPAAQARPFFGSSGSGGGVQAGAVRITPTPLATLPPDRADRIGDNSTQAAPVTPPPDRADGLGSARFPTEPQPTVVVRTTTSSSFSWTDAAVGAASGVVIVALIGLGTAIALRGRRRMALSA
jgi:hypothetical protein